MGFYHHALGNDQPSRQHIFWRVQSEDTSFTHPPLYAGPVWGEEAECFQATHPTQP